MTWVWLSWGDPVWLTGHQNSITTTTTTTLHSSSSILLSFVRTLFVRKSYALWSRVDCTQWGIYLICYIIIDRYCKLLSNNILVDWTDTTAMSKYKIKFKKVMPNLVKSSPRVQNIFYKMSNTTGSIGCVYLITLLTISDQHHVLNIEKKVQKLVEMLSLVSFYERKVHRLWKYVTKINYF